MRKSRTRLVDQQLGRYKKAPREAHPQHCRSQTHSQSLTHHLSCHEAHGHPGLGALALRSTSEICQSFLNVIKNFFMGTLANYEAPDEPSDPDVDMKDAEILLQKLADPSPETSKDNLMKIMVHSFLCSHRSLLESSPFQR
ncbi:hypothetical protein MC885_017779 [Smutsia gigantea]|nr:hypothetical protein MC885_017779 [Smutsia gigantea]